MSLEGPGWRVERRDDAKGRRVVATRAFQAGDLILEDPPIAWAVVADQQGAFCDCCLKPIAQVLRCSACKLACYASRDHQARAWREGHKEECAALRACAPRAPPAAVRLALRCALRHWRAQQQEQQAQRADRWEQLLGLEHHWADLGDAQKLEFAQMAALAHRLLADAAPGAAEAAGGPRELALLLARFACNSHTISDDELQPVAAGIFPLGAMVNHSCCPNAVHAFAGPRIQFRAVRPIAPGEEVTTSYTELAAARWERRRELLRHQQFDIDAGQAPAAGPAAAGPAAGGPAATADAAAGTSAAAEPGGSSAAADAAAGAAAEAVRDAALQCLPAQQPAATVALPGLQTELRCYGCRLPPWPHDERDIELTAVVPAAGSGGSQASGMGMWGSLGLAAGPAAAPASASFDVGDASDAAAAGSAVAGAAAAAAQQEAQQQQTSSIVHCWSDGQRAPSPEQQQLAQRYTAALRLQQQVDARLAAGEASAAAAELRAALQALCGGGQPGSAGAGLTLALGPRHVLRLRLLADLHRAAVAAGQWEAALRAARELLPLYQAAYPPVWPQLGLLWAGIAKLEHLLEHPGQALAAAREALRILAATHGGGAAVEAMRRVEAEAGQELAQGRGRGARPESDGSDSD